MGEGGLIDKVKGRLKEAAGSLLDDEDLRRKGRADQKTGEAKETAEDLIDRASDKAKDVMSKEESR